MKTAARDAPPFVWSIEVRRSLLREDANTIPKSSPQYLGHPRESGDPVALVRKTLDSRFRGNDEIRTYAPKVHATLNRE
jgi:hypothetical protein